MKKVIPVAIALILIILIAGLTFGKQIMEKYSYSNERRSLTEYYDYDGEHIALMVQDELLEERGLLRNNILYFHLGFIHEYFSDNFYVDRIEQTLLFTTPTEVKRAGFGENAPWSYDFGLDQAYTAVFVEEDVIYVAADYIKLFCNFSYDLYDSHVQIYTQWGVRELMTITQDTHLRVLGGIKSDILCDLTKGDQVEILEEMETWSKVKTSDSVIGYVENKRLSDKTTDLETPVTDVPAFDYTSLTLEKKICLGWHAIGGEAGNDTLTSVASAAEGMNVIAPTWFSLCDEEGNFRSYASASYVERAHNLDLMVWGVWDDFNYSLDEDTPLDLYKVLSSSTIRTHMIENMIQASLELSVDGINLDFEKIGADTGPHYIQFLRELSVSCRNAGLILSIDNYVPFQYNDYYRLDIQGQIADYVIIMGYDEHWSGSNDPGSVASIGYVKNGITKTLEDVPSAKVINALPFYTILWKIDGAQVQDEYLTIRNTEDFLDNHSSIEPVWDEETCQNYMEWETNSGLYRIWLEDERSIGVKLNVMNVNNLGGVAIWRLGYGNEAVWKLIRNYAKS
ncbi:MAG: chitinase [Lachnospiraceae bacterium]|jgi:spore germination protein YaaH|nr:chitinase [Lachnospiraceae bacterium]